MKGGEQIADALTLIGAKNAMMTLENVRVKKDVRNRINRQLNCDERKLARQIENAQAQLADIELIRRKIGLDRLPASLREMARVRAEHAEDPLAALESSATRRSANRGSIRACGGSSRSPPASAREKKTSDRETEVLPMDTVRLETRYGMADGLTPVLAAASPSALRGMIRMCPSKARVGRSALNR